MSRIIYQSPRRDQEYLINEDAQQLLAYLYLYGSAHPNQLADQLNYQNGDDVVESIDNVLCKNKAGFVVMRYTGQLTLNNEQVPEVSLTRDGKRFVNKYKSELPLPFSVHQFIKEQQKLEENIKEALQSVESGLEYYDEKEHTQELEEMMTRLEEYFDEVRKSWL